MQSLCKLSLVSPKELDDLKSTHEWGMISSDGAEIAWVKLKDCNTEQLEDILINEASIAPITRLVILSLLKERWNVQDRFLLGDPRYSREDDKSPMP
jgi:hypothetical protein